MAVFYGLHTALGVSSAVSAGFEFPAEKRPADYAGGCRRCGTFFDNAVLFQCVEICPNQYTDYVFLYIPVYGKRAECPAVWGENEQGAAGFTCGGIHRYFDDGFIGRYASERDWNFVQHWRGGLPDGVYPAFGAAERGRGGQPCYRCVFVCIRVPVLPHFFSGKGRTEGRPCPALLGGDCRDGSVHYGGGRGCPCAGNQADWRRKGGDYQCV